MKENILYCILMFLAINLYARCDKNVDILIKKYKDIKGCRKNYIIFTDGSTLIYDDGKKKNFDKLLNNPDIEDIFYYKYPKNFKNLNRNDAGRIRNEQLFKKIYGKNKNTVYKNLVTINWFGEKIKINKLNDVVIKLKNVEKKLKNLIRKKSDIEKFLFPLGGTFNWRYISGTKRLSAHSFGIAIDLNTKYANYWKWSKNYKNKIPLEIVKVFESEGFIWGGKWKHFDTMHFEYRPELIKKN